METVNGVLGSLEARPEWLRNASIQNHYSSLELSGEQFEYIITLESAARELAVNGNTDELQAKIDDLQKQLSTARMNHHADIARIGDRFIEEANDRGYCEAYDDIIADLNRELTVELPTRLRNYIVEIDVTGVLRVSVESSSIEDAEDAARAKVDFRYFSTGDDDVELYDGNIEDYRVVD